MTSNFLLSNAAQSAHQDQDECNYSGEHNINQLLDGVEHDIMSYQNRGLRLLLKPKAEADEFLLIHEIMRKPNSIIVLLYICLNNGQKKTFIC